MNPAGWRLETQRREVRDLLRSALASAGYPDARTITDALRKKGERHSLPVRTINRYLEEGPPLLPKNSSIVTISALGELAGIQADLILACDSLWSAAQKNKRDSESSSERHGRDLPSRWYGIIPIHGDRTYPSVDLVTIEKQTEENFEGIMRRILPPHEAGYCFKFTGTRYGFDALFLYFRPLGDTDPVARGSAALRRVGSNNFEYEGNYTRIVGVGDGQSYLTTREYGWRRTIPQDALHGVALLNFDSTLCDGWTLKPWLSFLSRHGVPQAQDSLVAVSDLLSKLQSSEDDQDEIMASCANYYAQAIDGQSASRIDELARTFVRTTHHASLYSFARPFIQHLINVGVAPILVSGAPEPVVKYHAERFGVEQYRALQIGTWARGTVYGRTVLNNPGMRRIKKNVVAEIIDSGREIILAAGTSVADLPLWDAAINKVIVGDRSPEADWSDARVLSLRAHTEPPDLGCWLDEQLEELDLPPLPAPLDR